MKIYINTNDEKLILSKNEGGIVDLPWAARYIRWKNFVDTVRAQGEH